MLDQLVGSVGLAAFGQAVMPGTVGFPLAGGGVHRQHKIDAGTVTRLFDGTQDIFRRVLVPGKVGRKAALIPHRCRPAVGFQQRLQRVEHLSTPAQRFGNGGRADGQDHKFLHVHRVCRVGAAVEDVHHRHGQVGCRRAAQKAVQRHFLGSRCRLRRRQRCRQNRIGAQMRLVLGAVRRQKRRVHGVQVPRVQPLQCLLYRAVQVCRRLGHALAAVAGGVVVPQLQRLKRAGRCPAGRSAPARRAVFQNDFRLHGRVPARIQNFTPHHGFYGKFIHSTHPRFVVRGSMDGILLFYKS